MMAQSFAAQKLLTIWNQFNESVVSSAVGMLLNVSKGGAMSTNQTYRDLFDKALSNEEINALSALQVGEISAVQAYDQALDRVKNMELVPTLEECRESHAQRAAMLRVRLR